MRDESSKSPNGWSAQMAELAANGKRKIHSAAPLTETITDRNWASRFLVILIAIALCGFVYWASLSRVEQVVRGEGKVIPGISTQVIQSLEGGIVSEVLVKEGVEVKTGQVLMKFNDVQFASRYKEDAAKRDSLGVRLARLKAEAEGMVSPTFPETQGESPALKESVEVEELLFRIRRADLTATSRVFDEKIKFRTEKLRLLMPLFLDGAMSEVSRLELESEIAELKGQIETNETAFRRKSMEQYDEERLKLRALEESIRAEEDRLTRTTFVSPVDGTVNKIFVDSPGRVVQGGQSIMEVVPKEDTLLVEAKIRPADVAFIKEGHRVVLRFTAYDFTTYGGMDGEVETLGVDTIAGEDKDVYYPVRIRTASNSLGHDRVTGEALVLRPGMVAEVDILTGERTVLDYLLKPIHRARKLALRER